MSAFRWCCAFAEAGLRVNVNDLNQASLDTLESGRLPFIEYGAEAVLAKALAGKRLVFTNSSDRISTDGPVIITIGTPIDEFLNPVRRVVQDCIDAMLPSLADGQLYGAALDRVSRHHRLAGVLSGGERAQAEGGVLPRARGAGLWAQGAARNAADRQRHHARKPSAKQPRYSSGSRRKSWWSARSRPSSPSCLATPIATSSSPRPMSSIWSPSRPASIISACLKR